MVIAPVVADVAATCAPLAPTSSIAGQVFIASGAALGVGDGAGVMEIVIGVVSVYDGEAFCVAIWIVQVCGAEALVVVILSVLCAYRKRLLRAVLTTSEPCVEPAIGSTPEVLPSRRCR